MLTLSELRKKNLQDLMAELKKAYNGWKKMDVQVKMSQDKKSHTLQQNRRYIAKIKTVVRQKTATKDLEIDHN